MALWVIHDPNTPKSNITISRVQMVKTKKLKYLIGISIKEANVKYKTQGAVLQNLISPLNIRTSRHLVGLTGQQLVFQSQYL